MVTGLVILEQIMDENILVREDEVLEDLMVSNMKIIQKKDGFRFGTDAVLLWKFAEIKGTQKVLDIGTGTGVISFLLSSTNKSSTFYGIDVIPDNVDMARRSSNINGLSNRVVFENIDVKDSVSHFGKCFFDTIVTNPPYKTFNTGIPNDKYNEYVARAEVLCTLEDIVQASAFLLKPGGAFYMVQRPDRLVDTFELMRRYKLEPKKLTMVHGKANKAPVMFLVKGVRGAGKELKVTDPIILEDNDDGRMY